MKQKRLRILSFLLSVLMIAGLLPLQAAAVDYTWGDWSSWQTYLPASYDDYETKTQYRYRDKEYTSSTDSDLSGWTQTGSSTEYGGWGGWSGWQPGSTGGSDTREVQTATVYGYYYFQCPNCGKHWHGWNFNCFYWAGGCGTYVPEGSWHQMWSDVSWSQAGFQDFYGTGKYVTHYFGEDWFRWDDNGQPRAGFRYRDRSKTVTYNYERWDSWSDWQDSYISDSSDREVSTRTLYRYRNQVALYTIGYDANGGSGAPAAQTKRGDSSLTLSTGTPSKSFRLTYNANGGSVSTGSKTVSATFLRWNTSPTGAGSDYHPGDVYNANGDATLYAQWSNPKAGTLPTPTRANYNFDGWYTAASGGSRVTASTVISGSKTLYAHWTASNFTVTYDANGGTGAPAAQTKQPDVALTLSSQKPTKSYTITYYANGGSISPANKTVNATFKNWNAAKDGSSAAFNAGASYTLNTNITLYAQWTNPKAGTLPTPTRSGYSFAGWYTAASGGTRITADATITKTQTLYAHWTKINTFTVSYNANGGTGAPAAQTKTEKKDLTLSTAKPTKSYKLVYSANGGSVFPANKTVNATFKNWNTRADGKGGSYSAGGVYTTDAAITLYAQWTNPKAGTLPTPTRSDYSFAGWYTEASGGTRITADTTITKTQTIYAHWSKTKTFTVSYNANGGSGAPAAQTKTEKKDLTLSKTIPAKSYKITYNANGGKVSAASKTVNAKFSSWNTKADGKGVSYAAGAVYKTDANLSLYAIWTNPKADVLATPTREGYTFSGWFTAKDGGSQITNASTITKSQTLYAHWTKKDNFNWGKDNWNFINDDSLGFFPSGTYRSQISKTYLDKLAQNLSNSEYELVFHSLNGGPAALDREWIGSCYGMSALTLLAKQGMVPYASYKKGAATLHDLNAPKQDANVNSLITYYHMLQYKDVIQQQYRTVPNTTNEANIKKILEQIDRNGVALISFVQRNFGGHAILAYGYEYASYRFDNSDIPYQGCIKVCDPNSAMAYSERNNIYFNTQSYEWMIPAYLDQGVSSEKGARFYYIGANVSELNAGGYLSGGSAAASGEFVARMNAPVIGSNRTVSKLKKDAGGAYVTMSAKPNEIREDYSYTLGAPAGKTFGYNLYDAASAYRVKQEDPAKVSLQIDYKTCNLSASSSKGTSIVFDPSGYIEVEAQKADYTMGMTFDKGYPTDWFTVSVSGSGVNKASLKKAASGYVLSADQLKNVTVSANNRTATATRTFSVPYTSVLIYEVNSTTIGLKVDKDKNGTYETVYTETVTVLPGDVDKSGDVTAADARLALRAAVGLETYKKGAAEFIAADVDKSGAIEASDARSILRAAVGLEKLK